jgi:hypothetical protein
MYTPRSLLSAALACCAVVSAGCTDITAPLAIQLSDTSQRLAVSQDGAGSSDNSQAHAIHVTITNMVFNTTVVDEYTFQAVRHGGDVNGDFRLYQLRLISGVEEAVVIASGPIKCLTVTENRARVGGRVTMTTFPAGIPVGSEITWSVTDNGKNAKADDTASQPLGNNAQDYCGLGLPYPEQPVERGKVQVRG